MTQPRAVSFAACADYGGGLTQAVSQALAPLGGIEAFIRPGQTVLLKPNLLTDRAPDEAVTTHPEVVRAVAGLVRASGARPIVADSPANAVKIERVWERTGIGALCEREGIPLVSLEEAGSVRFEEGGCRFGIAKSVLDADAVINMPKVKTHLLTTLTAAVKNMYGTVPGFEKTNLHQAHPLPSDFGILMAAIYREVPPVLTLADAVVGMEGDGPSAGQPARLGFLAASADAVALDLALCGVLHIRPESVPYLPLLRTPSEGLRPSDVPTVGARPSALSPASFRIPATVAAKLVPRFLLDLLPRLVWVRPTFSAACIACGRCVRACPGKALAMPGHGRKPTLSARRCVGCCCCHEVCPRSAVRMKQSPLLNLIRRGPMA
jgi:uncharacterized protein (DUF362 family)/Pyruvate/2-oxoacid:ferredoxin oxidoreductase delta subunit